MCAHYRFDRKAAAANAPPAHEIEFTGAQVQNSVQDRHKHPGIIHFQEVSVYTLKGFFR